MNMETVLSVRHLKKKIGRKWIIEDVSFDIGSGEIFGFLGPNGSGKTTTIRMLVDLIRPTEGQITICGKDINKDRNEALQYVGSIVENPEMYPYMTGWDNLAHFARMIPGISDQRIHEVIAIVGMQNRIHDKVKKYSLGMRQRLGIAQALLGSPKLLILDEPTNGLDPQGIKELREFIRTLADQGLSLFISSHLLSEIQMMCDRVAIISHGKVIAVGGVDELLQQTRGSVLFFVDQLDLPLKIFAEEGMKVKILQEEELYDRSVTDGMRVIEAIIEPEQAAACNRKLIEAGIEVFAVEHRKPTLEQLFLGLTGGGSID